MNYNPPRVRWIIYTKTYKRSQVEMPRLTLHLPLPTGKGREVHRPSTAEFSQVLGEGGLIFCTPPHQTPPPPRILFRPQSRRPPSRRSIHLSLCPLTDCPPNNATRFPAVCSPFALSCVLVLVLANLRPTMPTN